MITRRVVLTLAAIGIAGTLGCRNHMPHAFTWPAGGDVQQTHANPPEGGYYSNWDPWAVELEVTPLKDVNRFVRSTSWSPRLRTKMETHSPTDAWSG